MEGSQLTGNERLRYVRRMFGRIARRYDLLNRLMTFGQDVRWRQQAVSFLDKGKTKIVLDLGSGTGDLAVEILRQQPAARVVACDYTPEMAALGKQRTGDKAINWVICDALNLPFDTGVFGAVTSGFLLRNVPDVQRALAEQARVLQTGGQVISLDTTPPPDSLLKPFILIHLRFVIPLLGRLVAGDPEAYRYLPASTERFLSADKLAQVIHACGFGHILITCRMFGTIAIHCAIKDSSASPAQPNG